MLTECSADLFGFAPVDGRAVVAGFDGGKITSDAGALLLGATDRAIRLVERFTECFTDSRAAELIEHEVRTLVGQRVFGIALGYEDLVDHDELRHDPTMAVLKPLSVGVVLLDLVPAAHHQPDLFAADNHRRQKLSPPVDRINDRYGRCAIGFGLFPPDVRAFKGHAAFHRVPERWEF